MDLQALEAEIVNDPLSRGYAGMTDSQLYSDLREKIRPLVVVTPITLGEVLSALAVGDDQSASLAFARDFAAAAAADAAVGVILPWLAGSERTVDVSHSTVRALLDDLAARGKLAADSVSKIKTLAERFADRLAEIECADANLVTICRHRRYLKGDMRYLPGIDCD